MKYYNSETQASIVFTWRSGKQNKEADHIGLPSSYLGTLYHSTVSVFSEEILYLGLQDFNHIQTLKPKDRG